MEKVTVTCDGAFKMQYVNVQISLNQYLTYPYAHHRKFSVDVWTGIINAIRLYFIPKGFVGRKYLRAKCRWMFQQASEIIYDFIMMEHRSILVRGITNWKSPFCTNGLSKVVYSFDGMRSRSVIARFIFVGKAQASYLRNLSRIVDRTSVVQENYTTCLQ